ncbi:hypothetical protein LLH23_15350 [bacterium]|nr:hypothetical protein [bacterium]
MTRFCLMLLCLLLSGVAHAADIRSAQLLWSGMELFPQARAANTLSCAPRGSAKIGGQVIPSIFLHPQNTQKSTLTYPPLDLLLGPDRRAFLLSFVGISEGFDWQDQEHKPDGVRFTLQYTGRDLAMRTLTQSVWAPLAAALTPEGGALKGAISLATDPGPAGNTNYDWALFGQPLVASLPAQPLPPDVAVSGCAGLLVVEKPTGATVVEGLDAAGRPVPDATAAVAPAEAEGLSFVRFDFSAQTACVAWRWRGEGTAWGGSWQPEVRLVAASLSRQAVNCVGDRVTGSVSVRNVGLGTLGVEHAARVSLGARVRKLERLAPGATVEVPFEAGQTAPVKAGTLSETAAVSWQDGQQKHEEHRSVSLTAWPAFPQLPPARATGSECREVGSYLLLQNRQSRWLINRDLLGLGAYVWTWGDGGWEPGGSVTPWVQTVDATGREVSPTFGKLQAGVKGNEAQLSAEGTGRGFACRLQATLGADSPALKLDLELTAQGEQRVLAVRGPAVHAGDRQAGPLKSVAVFPGLEYLEGDERSSSDRDLAPPLDDRRVPHQFKVTVPMMIVQAPRGALMGLMWDAQQQWDGTHVAPGACFATPDFVEGMSSHLMQLQLPATPDGIPENQRLAAAPVTLKAGETWRLSQYIVAAEPVSDATEALVWFDKLVGYPAAEAWPRSFEEEMALCRHAFLVTVWDEQANKGRHVVGWGSANSPGHATLMLLDGRAVAQGAERTKLLARADLVGNQTVQQEGAKGLASRANCHIMGWEFPYHWGSLPGALDGMRGQAEGAMKSQEANGGWGYHPGKGREKLGADGTQTMGTCGREALSLARWAAISGNSATIEALRKAMDRLRRFPVPRGAQGWECPILEPDVLASAYALRAAVWAYMATGDQQYLADARFYARTGLPFQYAWDDGRHPGMRYASIPVFGSTFFTHSWIGLPVQWCGLVYAYGLQELMRFDQSDLWARQVDGMVASGMHQQWPMDNEKLAGTYPDSFGQWFTTRNGVYINPENIQLNLMARRGLDPGLRSLAVKAGERTLHVTAPGDLQTKAGAEGLTVSLKYLPGEIAYLTVGGLGEAVPTAVSAGGQALPGKDDLPHGATGWALRRDLGLLVVGGKCDAQGRLEVVVKL